MLTDRDIAAAATEIRAGNLVAFPTETVYGLGADATSGTAAARIFEAKGRPQFNPLIAHVEDLVQALQIGHFDPISRHLISALWPGPLTLVVPKSQACPVADLATAGLDTVAVRMPDHPVATALIRAAGVPIVAPSANRSGHVSATTIAHVREDLGPAVSVMLDSGPCRGGLESTIVQVVEDEVFVLRPGGTTIEDLSHVLGPSVAITAGHVVSADAPSAPGQLASHYAPQTPVRLNVTTPEPDEALLVFGPVETHHPGPQLNLSEAGDLTAAAANLFSALRKLDKAGCKAIAVAPIPDVGLGTAINDRLRRAAA
ncbi:MAG: L-threonylcarbamoyladenylate synthase [Pseudomonadota bacterium]